MAKERPPLPTTAHSALTEWGTTERDERFCVEFVRDYNATLAMVRAGYTGKQPSVIGSNALRKQAVRDRIVVLQKEIFDRCKSSLQLVISELLAVAFFDPRRLATWDEDGTMKMRASKDLTIEEARMIESMEMRCDAKGNPVIKFKRASKMDALKTLTLIHKDVEIGVDVRENARKLRYAVDNLRGHGGPGGVRPVAEEDAAAAEAKGAE